METGILLAGVRLGVGTAVREAYDKAMETANPVMGGGHGSPNGSGGTNGSGGPRNVHS